MLQLERSICAYERTAEQTSVMCSTLWYRGHNQASSSALELLRKFRKSGFMINNVFKAVKLSRIK